MTRKPVATNTVAEIKSALESAVVALGDLTPEGEQPDPYVADAKSFANQAAYCLGKQIESGPSEPKRRQT